MLGEFADSDGCPHRCNYPSEVAFIRQAKALIDEVFDLISGALPKVSKIDRTPNRGGCEYVDNARVEVCHSASINHGIEHSRAPKDKADEQETGQDGALG